MKLKRILSSSVTLFVALAFTPAVVAFATPQDSSAATATKKAKKSAKDAADQADKAAGSAVDSAKTAVTGKPSQSDIDAAKASGKVWVNTSSGVYHHGGKDYGNTKQGKFMTEDDARKAGFHAAKNEKNP